MITVGQTPRTDVMDDITSILGPNIEVIQKGSLDDMTTEELLSSAPEKGDYVLVSRLKSGHQIRFSEQKILPRLQKAIQELEKSDVVCILMLCTGKFPP